MSPITLLILLGVCIIAGLIFWRVPARVFILSISGVLLIIALGLLFTNSLPDLGGGSAHQGRSIRVGVLPFSVLLVY